MAHVGEELRFVLAGELELAPFSASSRVRASTFCSRLAYDSWSWAAMWLNASARASSSPTATDVDAVLQGPGANLGRPDLQGADGGHHLARQEQAHQHRQPQTQEQQHGIAQQRGVERGKRLPQGLARNTDQPTGAMAA